MKLLTTQTVCFDAYKIYLLIFFFLQKYYDIRISMMNLYTNIVNKFEKLIHFSKSNYNVVN